MKNYSVFLLIFMHIAAHGMENKAVLSEYAQRKIAHLMRIRMTKTSRRAPKHRYSQEYPACDTKSEEYQRKIYATLKRKLKKDKKFADSLKPLYNNYVTARTQ